MTRWSLDDVEGQAGRTVIVTGANSGIGFETARVLAARGAHVVLACRSPEKATAAAARITAESPDASLTVQQLDLASLESVRSAAARISEQHTQIDLLINNAGVMMTPFRHTADGFEYQLGVNHLGHFALTGLLLDRLLGTPGSRVVIVSSAGHHRGSIQFDDLQFEAHRYNPRAAYAQAKLANLLFAYGLQRRLKGTDTCAVAVHPGVVPTDLPQELPFTQRIVFRAIARLFGQPDVAAGALATLRAATDPGVRGGEYVAPDGRPPLRAKGQPVVAESSVDSYDGAAQDRLWQESERLTGVQFPAT